MKQPVDAEFVIYRLEEAGKTLLSLPNGGVRPAGFSSNMPTPVRTAIESYGWDKDPPVRAPVPASEAITRMDEALRWLSLIPQDRYVLRRIVGARALVSPMTERHLYTWRRLARVLGCDHRAVQRWHGEGVGLVVLYLNRGNFISLDQRVPNRARKKDMAAADA